MIIANNVPISKHQYGQNNFSLKYNIFLIGCFFFMLR